MARALPLGAARRGAVGQVGDLAGRGRVYNRRSRRVGRGLGRVWPGYVSVGQASPRSARAGPWRTWRGEGGGGIRPTLFQTHPPIPVPGPGAGAGPEGCLRGSFVKPTLNPANPRKPEPARANPSGFPPDQPNPGQGLGQGIVGGLPGKVRDLAG